MLRLLEICSLPTNQVSNGSDAEIARLCKETPTKKNFIVLIKIMFYNPRS